MKFFCLFENMISDIFCEESAPSGVKRIVNTISEDLFLVTEKKPNIINRLDDSQCENIIIIATIGKSALIDSLVQKGLLDTESIAKKRECYLMKVIETPFPEFSKIKQALLIIGSDKRGTIYGMFRLSEICGVSPLVFWGDAKPEKKDLIRLEFENDIISKEPSVKYRGFFINDEWPAFGKWCLEKYGGVNAKVYDKVFELVLRLKGNYLLPAMWQSSFSEDGPGLENARLADEYGVIMGSSHHEPLCRAGVEWQNQYKNYGDDNAWSFISNSDAVTEFWKDGILRNKDFENIITIGMRGENDSHLLGEGASIQDNINVLKKAIVVQNQLLKENINHDLEKIPRMFAIYKEVEDFYFGADGYDGLRDWDGIKDVILLFSDDNHGQLRAIPQPSDKPHSGGCGIYYHFDYHGAPYSYEWLNHTNLAKAWEQLTMAYEYGICDMWIVNVGDIKGNEYPLSFFMDLAYDYTQWGISNLNSAAEYTKHWIDVQFGDSVSPSQKLQIHNILDAYTTWSTVRIPESLNPNVFMNNFYEIENMHKNITNIMAEISALRNELRQQCLAAFESMIYFPAMAFFNTMLINLEAGMNHIHAERGTLVANQYSISLLEKISMDRFYINEFHKLLNGKWNHMMESAHMCFRTWDDNNWTYPTIQTIAPIPHPKIVVSFRGNNIYDLGHHWQDRIKICNAEMTRPDVNRIIFDIDSRSDIDFYFTITCDKQWLSFSQTNGKSRLKEQPQISIEAFCDKEKLSNDEEIALIEIKFGFLDGTTKQAFLNVKASNKNYSDYNGAFIESNNYLCIHADNYNAKTDVDGMGWRIVHRLGRTGNAIKSFPVIKNWENENNRPYVRYDFIISEKREYIVCFYLSPRNPMIKDGTLKGCFSVNDSQPQLFDIVEPGYCTKWSDKDWNCSVTNNIRKISIPVSLNRGLNYLKFYTADPNVILENIVLYPKDIPIPATHLAPPESYRVPMQGGQ